MGLIFSGRISVYNLVVTMTQPLFCEERDVPGALHFLKTVEDQLPQGNLLLMTRQGKRFIFTVGTKHLVSGRKST